MTFTCPRCGYTMDVDVQLAGGQKVIQVPPHHRPLPPPSPTVADVPERHPAPISTPCEWSYAGGTASYALAQGWLTLR